MTEKHLTMGILVLFCARLLHSGYNMYTKNFVATCYVASVLRLIVMVT